MAISCWQPLCKVPCFLVSVSYLGSSSFLQNPQKDQCKWRKDLRWGKEASFSGKKRGGVVCGVALLPVDPWAPSIDSQSIASQLFAFSLFPYIGFLYFITKSKSAPKLTLFGFYFLLAFVGATTLFNYTDFVPDDPQFLVHVYGAVPAGIYAKVHYGTSLSNVDWLHGGAESLLTLTNLFIVLGLRQALRINTQDDQNRESDPVAAIKDKENSSV